MIACLYGAQHNFEVVEGNKILPHIQARLDNIADDYEELSFGSLDVSIFYTRSWFMLHPQKYSKSSLRYEPAIHEDCLLEIQAYLVCIPYPH
jgi:hypothetical protein